jgi:predicted PurR-regulated permease PerM
MIPVCISALLAFLMNPLVRFLRGHRVPRSISVILSACTLVLPLLLVLTLMVYQIRSFIIDFSAVVAGLNQNLILISKSRVFRHLHLPLTMSEVLEQATSGAGYGVPALLSGLEGALTTSSKLILVLVFSVAMLGRCNV